MTEHIPEAPTPTALLWSRVKIADIAIREDWQVRNKIDRATVNTYKNIYKNGGQLPPIKVALVDGTLRLVDGWHRLQALQLLGEALVDATVTTATMLEAQYAAAMANMSHGLPLKPSEVRKVFNVYIKTRQHITKTGRIKSYRDMQEDLHNRVSHKTIYNWMQKDHPKIAAKMAEQYRDEDKARYHNGGPPAPDYITPMQAAQAALDQAVAEARSMAPEERGLLIFHAQSMIADIERVGSWKPYHPNPDF